MIQNNTVGSYFKSSTILFGAFIFGVVNFGFFIVVLYFMGSFPLDNFDEDLTIYFILGCTTIFISMLYLGNSVFKKKTNAVQNDVSFPKKLFTYREAKLIQAVTLEVSALVSMILLMLNTHIFFIVIALLSLVQMIRIFPKKQEMIKSLDLSYAEQQKLNNSEYKLN